MGHSRAKWQAAAPHGSEVFTATLLIDLTAVLSSRPVHGYAARGFEKVHSYAARRLHYWAAQSTCSWLRRSQSQRDSQLRCSPTPVHRPHSGAVQSTPVHGYAARGFERVHPYAAHRPHGCAAQSTGSRLRRSRSREASQLHFSQTSQLR